MKRTYKGFSYDKMPLKLTRRKEDSHRVMMTSFYMFIGDKKFFFEPLHSGDTCYEITITIETKEVKRKK